MTLRHALLGAIVVSTIAGCTDRGQPDVAGPTETPDEGGLPVAGPPAISDRLIFFSMDENAPTTIAGTGAVNITLTKTTGTTHAIAAHSGLGRRMDTFNAAYHRTEQGWPAFVTLAPGSSWTVATWFNKDIGYWGSGSGGGDFAGTGPYDLSAAYLLTNPGWPGVDYFGAVVYPLNWWCFNQDVSLSSVELVLYYQDGAGAPDFIHTGFFGNELVATPDGWHHVAVVNDLTANVITFYVDGTQVYSTTAVDVSWSGSGADQGVIKWGIVGSSVQLNNAWGSMDELYIFDRALTSTEVSTLAGI